MIIEISELIKDKESDTIFIPHINGPESLAKYNYGLQIKYLININDFYHYFNSSNDRFVRFMIKYICKFRQYDCLLSTVIFNNDIEDVVFVNTAKFLVKYHPYLSCYRLLAYLARKGEIDAVKSYFKNYIIDNISGAITNVMAELIYKKDFESIKLIFGTKYFADPYTLYKYIVQTYFRAGGYLETILYNILNCDLFYKMSFDEILASICRVIEYTHSSNSIDLPLQYVIDNYPNWSIEKLLVEISDRTHSDYSGILKHIWYGRFANLPMSSLVGFRQLKAKIMNTTSSLEMEMTLLDHEKIENMSMGETYEFMETFRKNYTTRHPRGSIIYKFTA